MAYVFWALGRAGRNRTISLGALAVVWFTTAAYPLPAVAQGETETKDGQPAQQWQELRAAWRDRMLNEIANEDSPLQQVAIAHLRENPPDDEAWNDFVREALQSEQLPDVNRGLRLLPSTTIPDDDRAELMAAALRKVGDRYMADRSGRLGERWRLLVTTRRAHPSEPESLVAKQILDKVDSSLRQNPELYQSVLTSMLAEDRPVPAAFNLLYARGTRDIDIAQRLLELSKTDDEQTAAMAALVMNEVLKEALRTAAERTQRLNKYSAYAHRMISRYDEDASGDLSADEWDSMLIDISSADADGNGRITGNELGQYLQDRNGSNRTTTR